MCSRETQMMTVAYFIRSRNFTRLQMTTTNENKETILTDSERIDEEDLVVQWLVKM